MKHKFSKILGIGLTLALLASMLVMGSPVAADNSVSSATVELGVATPTTSTTYTIKFTTTVALATTDSITVVFPETTPDLPGVVTVNTADVTETVSGMRVKLTGLPATPAGDVTLVFTGIKNPAAETYTLDVYTSQETTVVWSVPYTIAASDVSAFDVVIAPAAAGLAAVYTIGGVDKLNGGPLTAGTDTITIVFNDDTVVPTEIAPANVTVNTVAVTATPIVVGQWVTITTPTDVAGGETLTVVFLDDALITNPAVATNYYLDVYTSQAHRGTSGAYAVTEDVISQLVFTTYPLGVTENVSTIEIIVKTQDAQGNLVAVSGDTTINLSSTTTGIPLFDDSSAAFASQVTSVTIGIGTDTVSFWYKDDTPGTWTITAAAPDESWDDATFSIAVNPQTELYDGVLLINSYDTIQEAITAALPGDTVQVGPGIYEEDITVSEANLTLESTDGKASTTIAGGMTLDDAADDFVLGGAEGKGFTLEKATVVGGSGLKCLIDFDGPTDVNISYNTFDTGDGTVETNAILIFTAGATRLTVTQNAFLVTDQYDMGIRSVYNGADIVGLTVSYNTFTGVLKTDETSAVEILNLDISVTDSVITENAMTSVGNGVLIGSNEALGTGLKCHATESAKFEVSSNTFDDCNYGIDLVDAESTSKDQNVVITRNTFTDNTYGFAIDYGTYPEDTDNWEPEDFTVQYNDFSGNTYAVYNNKTTAVDAANNYWGSPDGPSTGDVSTNVDYSPWLDAPYPDGNPIALKAIDLYSGWNLISLPLIPTDASIGTVLAGAGDTTTIDKVTYYTGGPDGGWQLYTPTSSNLTEMNDGKGYWIDVSGTSLAFTAYGVDHALPGEAPSSYNIVEGWNLIGFTSTVEPTSGIAVETYLGPAVILTVEAMYSYNASTGAYEAVIEESSLTPGAGYWLAVNTAGKIYP